MAASASTTKSVTNPATALHHYRGLNSLEWLEKHPSTTRRQLGEARDLVNRVHNLNDPKEIWDAINDLENTVCGIYGGRPD